MNTRSKSVQERATLAGDSGSVPSRSKEIGCGATAVPSLISTDATNVRRSGLGGVGHRGRGRERGTVPATAFTTDIPVGQRGRGRGNMSATASATDVVPRGRGRGSNSSRGKGQRLISSSDDNTFLQATSSNLPFITCFTVAEYFRSLISSEVRHAKDKE